MTGLLLTGATGFVGGEALLRYIDRAPDHHFYLMVRSRDADHLKVRAEKILDAHFGDRKEEVRKRLTFFHGNLLKPALDISSEDRAMLVEKVDHVVHCAASVGRACVAGGCHIMSRLCVHFAPLVGQACVAGGHRY